MHSVVSVVTEVQLVLNPCWYDKIQELLGCLFVCLFVCLTFLVALSLVYC